MVYTEDNRICMKRGDYGIPIPIRVKPHCADCGGSLLDEDTVLFEVTKGEKVFVCRRKSWEEIKADNGVFTLELTEEESQGMCPGVYAWRLIWLREAGLQNCLMRSILEVVTV